MSPPIIHVMASYVQANGSISLTGTAVYRFFHRNQWYLVDALARLVSDYVKSDPTLSQLSFDLIMAIPRPGKTDGDDPPSLLEDWLSHLLGVRRMQRALVPCGAISEDADEDGTDASYRTTNPEGLVGKHVLLIDGVYCSGISFRLASEALIAAGATVTCLAITEIQGKKVKR